MGDGFTSGSIYTSKKKANRIHKKMVSSVGWPVAALEWSIFLGWSAHKNTQTTNLIIWYIAFDTKHSDFSYIFLPF